jgi:hypothetical protein
VDRLELATLAERVALRYRDIVNRRRALALLHGDPAPFLRRQLQHAPVLEDMAIELRAPGSIPPVRLENVRAQILQYDYDSQRALTSLQEREAEITDDTPVEAGTLRGRAADLIIRLEQYAQELDANAADSKTSQGRRMLDIKRALECRAVADEIERIAARSTSWDGRSPEAMRGERTVLGQRWKQLEKTGEKLWKQRGKVD